MKFDCLLAPQSKYDIRNLSFKHNPTSKHNKIKRDMTDSEEVFKGVFEFSVQETVKDLSRNGKVIVLKLELEAVIRI